MAPVLQVENLVKRYRRQDPLAVDGVSFDLEPAEVFGLLGPNGAGKTTVVKTAAGLVTPDSGHVELFGLAPQDPAARQHMALVPEDPEFPRFLRANEVLDYFARLYAIPADERLLRVTDSLTWANLHQEKRQVRFFSKGMKQRLGLAQAILARPRLLILDEPTADLDPIGRQAVRDIILHLRGQGVAVLLNSHLLSEVEMVCDRVAIMNRGKVLRLGPMSEVVGGGRTLEEVFLELVNAERPAIPAFVGGPG
ncbi:MAG: ABC transporter ATP-binding protein [Candidatus Dormibacteria bacterium]